MMHLAGNQTAGDQATLSWDRNRNTMTRGRAGATKLRQRLGTVEPWTTKCRCSKWWDVSWDIVVSTGILLIPHSFISIANISEQGE